MLRACFSERRGGSVMNSRERPGWAFMTAEECGRGSPLMEVFRNDAGLSVRVLRCAEKSYAVGMKKVCFGEEGHEH